MGIRNFFTQVITSSIIDATDNNYLSNENFKRFWTHSTAVSKACKFISNKLSKQSKNIDSNHAYLTGLFHDVGIPIMSARFEEYEEKIEGKTSLYRSLIDEEKSALQTDHSVVSYIVGKQWHLPRDVFCAISFHHEKDLNYYTNDTSRQLSIILRLSEIIISRISSDNIFSNITDFDEEEIYQYVHNEFGLTSDKIDSLSDEVVALLM